jgi:hypothetical protein
MNIPYNYDSKPTQPEEGLEVETCNFCGDMIEDGSSDGFEFDPKNATEDLIGGYIHEHCIAARRANDLSPEEHFSMVKLVAAMEIITEMSDELLRKFDVDRFVSFELGDLKESVSRQLELLNPDPSPFSEPELVFLRKQDVLTANVALAGAVRDAYNEHNRIGTAYPESDYKTLRLATQAECIDFIAKAHAGMKEASFA